MSSDAQSSAILKDEARRRKKLSRASRRKSSHNPIASPRTRNGSDNQDLGEEVRLSAEKLGPQSASGTRSESVVIADSSRGFNRSLMDLLEEIKEDVVTPKRVTDDLKCSRVDVVSSSSSENNQFDRMYLQTITGFKAVENQSERPHSGSEDDQPRISLAKSVQSVWMTLSTLCHGLLGGVSVTYIMYFWTTDPQDWPLDLLKKYTKFGQVFSNTFYFLATLCLVSVLDRMNFARFHINQPRSLVWLLILVIYGATILLSLSCDSIDSRLYLGGNVTINEDEIRRIFSIWNNLSVGRSAGGILGWIFLGTVSRPIVVSI